MYLIVTLGSVHEKFDVWTGPELLNMASGNNINNNSSNSYIAQPCYWCPSQYASPFPNKWQWTLRPETWSEQEEWYYLRHSPARCSATSDSSSTASTTKRERKNTWSTAEEEILLNLCREHKSGLKLPHASLSVPLHGPSVSCCHEWRQNTTKGLKGVEAHSTVLSKKIVLGRIPMDFPKPSLVSQIYPDSRMIHSTPIPENSLTPTRN